MTSLSQIDNGFVPIYPKAKIMSMPSRGLNERFTQRAVMLRPRASLGGNEINTVVIIKEVGEIQLTSLLSNDNKTEEAKSETYH